jgi:hypothetical protein
MKNFGMKEQEQYMAGKGRPRHGTRILSSGHRRTVMLSGSETSLAIPFAESKMI